VRLERDGVAVEFGVTASISGSSMPTGASALDVLGIVASLVSLVDTQEA
jgi:hypothetical protein